MVYLGPWLESRIFDDIPNNLADLERAFHAHLLSHNVAMQPGLSARCARPGWFRVTFSREAEYMDVALSRLDRALNNW